MKASGSAVADFCKHLRLDGGGLGTVGADSVVFCPLSGGTNGQADLQSWCDVDHASREAGLTLGPALGSVLGGDTGGHVDGRHMTRIGALRAMSGYWSVGSGSLRVLVFDGWNVRLVDGCSVDQVVSPDTHMYICIYSKVYLSSMNIHVIHVCIYVDV